LSVQSKICKFQAPKNKFQIPQNGIWNLSFGISSTNMEKFFFTRLQYRSGDWNTDQRMPSNILNSLVEYTTIPVDTQERVVALSSDEIFDCPLKSM